MIFHWWAVVTLTGSEKLLPAMGEVVKVSGGAPGFFLTDIMTSQSFADVALCCTGGQRFLAHRLVLSAASPYLHKILLAHGSISGHCELITVILAEVEGNDLAPILGFLYTGSVSLPKAQLQAFSSTADALSIAIPPLPQALATPESSSRDLVLARHVNYDLEREKMPLDLTRPRHAQSDHHCDNYPALNLEVEQMVNVGLELKKFNDRHKTSSFNIASKSHENIPARRCERRKVWRSKVIASPWNQTVRVYDSPKVSNISVPTSTQEDVPIDCVSSADHQRLSLTHEAFSCLNEPAVGVQGPLNNNPTLDETSTEISRTRTLHDRNNNPEFPSKSGEKDQLCDKPASKVTKKSPFRCSDCGKEFSQLRNFKYHRSVHEGTGEFAATCPECGKSFNDRGYLGSHMKIHRNRKEYACQQCGKSFNQRVAYNMHMRIHTGVKPHRCEQCGKAFSRKMLLKQHLRIHSGERPYQCHICEKSFADRSNMTLHTKLHSGVKPYECDICAKAFTKKHHLKTHLNFHTGEKPYSCPKCSLAFSQSSNMRTHYKKCSGMTDCGPRRL